VSLTKTYATTAGSSGGGTSLTTGTFDASAYTHAVAFIKHEGSSVTLSMADNKGTSVFNALTAVHHSNSDLHSQMFWWKIASPGTGMTVTASLSASRSFLFLPVWLINATGGTLEQDAEAAASGTSTTPDGGSLATTGVSVVSFMACGLYTAANGAATGGWSEDYDDNALGAQGWAGSRGPETTTPIDPQMNWAPTNDAWTVNSVSLREPSAPYMTPYPKLLAQRNRRHFLR
jgi:hypothetical protein